MNFYKTKTEKDIFNVYVNEELLLGAMLFSFVKCFQKNNLNNQKLLKEELACFEAEFNQLSYMNSYFKKALY